MPKRVAITGACGYIGGMLTDRLSKLPGVEKIIALDVNKPSAFPANVEFVQCDVRDKGLGDKIAGCDTMIHLAFIVAPIHDIKKTYDININGSTNVLRACENPSLKHLIAASSVAAYGRQPRNNEIITEETSLRGDSSSYYMHSKRIVEQHLDIFKKRNPQIVLTRLRPSILLGPKNNNFAQEVKKSSIVPIAKEGLYLPIIHEEDVVDAFMLAFQNPLDGAFNISLPEPMGIADFAKSFRKRTISMKTSTLLKLSKLGYLFRITDFSPDWVVSGENYWRIDISKAKNLLGWEPKRDYNQIIKDLSVM